MSKKLLIIDDSIEIHEIIASLLSNHFSLVRSATNVEEAVEELKTEIFDCIILDINLGGKNGAHVIKFLIESQNPNQEKPFIIISGLIGNSFVGKYKKKFAGVFLKPFDHNEFVECVEKTLNPEKPILNDALDAIPEVKCDLPFTIPFIEEKVQVALQNVRKNAHLRELFEGLKIDRSEGNYILAHIGILVNISTAISISMEWSTDKTLCKFVYAAYLHDMAISDRVDLARVRDAKDLELKKKTLSPEDYKLVMNHPLIAAAKIETITEIPSDVVHIVKQHHEFGNDLGFPNQISANRISPISAVFIVAHDLTDYILDNSLWSYQDYLKSYRSKFKGATFNKVYSALEKVLKE